MRCTLSACADADAFASFALSCARQGADLLLCHPDSGHADAGHADSGMGEVLRAGVGASGLPAAPPGATLGATLGAIDATGATNVTGTTNVTGATVITAAPHVHTAMPPGWTVWPGGEGQGPCCLVGIGPRAELCLGDPASDTLPPDHEPGPHTDAALAAFLG
ncbi:hypothetical protein EKK70_03465, partial [Desulfovibrio sp. DS-1]